MKEYKIKIGSKIPLITKAKIDNIIAKPQIIFTVCF